MGHIKCWVTFMSIKGHIVNLSYPDRKVERGVCLRSRAEKSHRLSHRFVGLVTDHAAGTHDETGTCPCTWFGDGVGWLVRGIGSPW